MSQKVKELFKEYVQRWRELASQAEPPLAEKELAKLFMDTIQPALYEKCWEVHPWVSLNLLLQELGLNMARKTEKL